MEGIFNVVLAFAIVIAALFTFHRIGDHCDIAGQGGIRKKYNLIFSYFFNLPNSEIKIETKSFVTFQIKDHRCIKSIRLNYSMDYLNITCKVIYFDDTPFDNGTKYEWSISQSGESQEKVIEKIRKTMADLP